MSGSPLRNVTCMFSNGAVLGKHALRGGTKNKAKTQPECLTAKIYRLLAKWNDINKKAFQKYFKMHQI